MNLRPDGSFTEEDADAFLEALLGEGEEEIAIKEPPPKEAMPKDSANTDDFKK